MDFANIGSAAASSGASASTGSLSAGDYSAIGGGLAAIASAFGASKTASANVVADQYQASVATNNAQIAGYQAGIAIQKGNTEANNSELETAGVYSSQRTAMAANGVDLSDSPSANNVLATTSYLGAANVAQIQTNAAYSAWGFQTEQASDLGKANFYNYAADQINPTEAGLTSLLGNASTVAAKWYSANKAGA